MLIKRKKRKWKPSEKGVNNVTVGPKISPLHNPIKKCQTHDDMIVMILAIVSNTDLTRCSKSPMSGWVKLYGWKHVFSDFWDYIVLFAPDLWDWSLTLRSLNSVDSRLFSIYFVAFCSGAIGQRLISSEQAMLANKGETWRAKALLFYNTRGQILPCL